MNQQAVQGKPRFRWLRRVLSVAILVSACAGAWWVGSFVRSPAGGEALAVDDAALTFGEVWEDPAFVWTLPLQNPNAHDLKVVRFVSSCSCLAVEPASLVVPARQRAEVKVTLNLVYRPSPIDTRDSADSRSSQLVPEGSGGKVYDFDAGLRPHPEGPQGGTLQQAGWTIRGRVRPTFTPSPRALHFGESLVRGQAFAPKTVSVLVHVPVKSLTARCEPALAEAVVRPVDGDERRFELTVLPNSTLAFGPVAFRVLLQGSLRDGTELPPYPVRVEGTVVEDIQALPALVQFGACPLGKTVQETIILHSLHEKAFDVEKIDNGSADLEVVPGTRVLPHRKEYRLSQKIARAENQSGRVEFAIRTGQGESLKVAVEVKYFGMDR